MPLIDREEPGTVQLTEFEEQFHVGKVRSPRFLLDMPHLLISTRIRLESGPTIVGDIKAAPELRAYLDAKFLQEKCNNP